MILVYKNDISNNIFYALSYNLHIYNIYIYIYNIHTCNWRCPETGKSLNHVFFLLFVDFHYKPFSNWGTLVLGNHHTYI